jgi:ATP-binding cassette, subfamily C (CFTR/MRP), member 1
MTALAEKTVVLVTHQVEFLTETSRILVSRYSEHNYSGLFFISKILLS